MRTLTMEDRSFLPDEMRRVPLLHITDAESIWLRSYERPMQPTGFITPTGQIVDGARVIAALQVWYDKMK